MGVPNTTTFELQDVVDEVNPTTDDLVDCFADANANYFDSTYEGSKNQLLNFRNYGSGNAFTSFYATSTTNKFSANVCGISVTLQLWHDGSGLIPLNGDSVYTNSAGTTLATWLGYRGFKSVSGSNSIGAAKSSSGVISDTTIC